MKVLIVFDQKETRDIVRFAVEKTVKTEVFESKSHEEAMGMIADIDGIELLILDVDGSGGKVAQYLSKMRSGIPSIICAREEKTDFSTYSKLNVLSVATFDQLADKIQSLVKEFASGAFDEPENDDEYCRIRTNVLVNVRPLKGDVYVRLGNGKHVRVFHRGATFEKADFERYGIEKNLEYMYLKAEDAHAFVKSLDENVTQVLETPNVSEEKATETAVKSHETIQELITKIGATDEVQELTKKSVALAMGTIKDNFNLLAVFKRLKEQEGNYISKHSFLLANVSCAIALTMDWKSESTGYKLSLAAFLHDITLKNNKLASVRSIEELSEKYAGDFTVSEIEQFKYHPIAAAELAQKFKDIPPDVDTIIAQHHEKPDGTGFPKRLATSRISPLSCLFILSHDVVDAIMEQGIDFDMETFLKKNKENYNAGNFRRVFNSLEAAVTSND